MMADRSKVAWLLVIVALLMFVALGLPYWFSPPSEKAALPVVTAVLPQRRDVPVSKDAMGMVSALPNNDVRLSPAVAGRIRAIPVHQGEWVRSGQLLAVLDARMLAAQAAQASAAEATARNELLKARRGSRPEEIAQAGSNVNQSKANLDAAQAALTRAQALYASKIAPRKDVEAAQAQYQTALAQYHSAQAQLRLARLGPRKEDKAIAATQYQQAQAAFRQSEVQLSNSRLVSPIAGRVDQVLMAVGDVADTTMPVIRVINLSSVQVKAALQADAASSVHAGQRVTILAPDHRTVITGKVQSVGGAFDASVNGFPVYITAPNSQEALKVGMLVQCSIRTGNHPNALLIPKAALLPDPETPDHFFVYVIENQNKVRKQSVTIGVETPDGQVEVTSGLDGRKPVVVQGGYGLEEDASVQVQVAR